MTIIPSNQRLRRFAITAVLAVYALAFFLPVTDASTRQAMYGYEAFLWALISVIYIPMWLANPSLWAGCVFLSDGNWRLAFRCGITATVLAVSEVWFWDDVPEIGYYVWTTSMVLLTLAGLVLRRASRTEPSPTGGDCARVTGETSPPAASAAG